MTRKTAADFAAAAPARRDISGCNRCAGVVGLCCGSQPAAEQGERINAA